MSPLLRGLGLLAMGAAMACEQAPTQVVVVVDQSQMMSTADVDQLQLHSALEILKT